MNVIFTCSGFTNHSLVPEGCTLGPHLFTVDMNDINTSSSKINFTMFADDTIILYFHKDFMEVTIQVNK